MEGRVNIFFAQKAVFVSGECVPDSAEFPQNEIRTKWTGSIRGWRWEYLFSDW